MSLCEKLNEYLSEAPWFEETDNIEYLEIKSRLSMKCDAQAYPNVSEIIKFQNNCQNL